MNQQLKDKIDSLIDARIKTEENHWYIYKDAKAIIKEYELTNGAFNAEEYHDLIEYITTRLEI